MTTQPELPFDVRPPTLLVEGAAWFSNWLLAHPDGPGPGGAWPGRAIASAIGRPWSEATRRLFRAYRNSAGPLIVSGPAGYSHVRHTPLEARAQAARVRLAQARKMAREAIRELRALDAAGAISGTP